MSDSPSEVVSIRSEAFRLQVAAVIGRLVDGDDYDGPDWLDLKCADAVVAVLTLADPGLADEALALRTEERRRRVAEAGWIAPRGGGYSANPTDQPKGPPPSGPGSASRHA